MNAEAMRPFGNALLAYADGDSAAELIIRRDDGVETPLPVKVFFRHPSQFTPIDCAAIDQCSGRVLDVGGGTGIHAVVAQQSGLVVTAIDVNPAAVDIMRRAGVKDVRCVDVFEFRDGPYDTILMLGHGIGMVETIDGLDRFLSHAHALVSDGGQILLDSLDVRATQDAANLAYHQANRQSGRYIGEVRMQFEFDGELGPYCGWLQIDDNTLRQHADAAGWRCQVVQRGAGGGYLARLTKHRPA